MLRARTTHNYFLWLLTAILSLNSACSFFVQQPVPGPGQPPPVAPVISSVPFSTKEPATYQADIVISFPGESSAVEQKYFTVRDGERRRTDYELSAGNVLSIIENAEGRSFILRSQKKCADEEKFSPGNVAAQSDGLRDFLTNSWLAEKTVTSFEDLGQENVNGKNLAKYRVKYDKTGGVQSASEALVWVDEELGMPVKTEMYSSQNGERAGSVTIEFRNVNLSVTSDTFLKPAGCQNIAEKDLQKILWQERLNAE